MRKRVDFWLDEQRPSDLKVWKVVQKLRSKRVFSQTVKDGILIMNQLMAGKTDLLFAKFPWIVDKVLASVPPTTPSDSGDLQRQISAAVATGVQQAIMNAPALPATALVAVPIKPSAAPPKAIIGESKKASAEEIANNFLLSF